MHTRRDWYTALVAKWGVALLAVLGVGWAAWGFSHDWLVAVISTGAPAELAFTTLAEGPVSYAGHKRQAERSRDEADAGPAGSESDGAGRSAQAVRRPASDPRDATFRRRSELPVSRRTSP